MKIITSSSTRGVYLAMLSQIREGLTSSQENVVIVPDRFTLNVERGLLEGLHADGAFNLTVTSFTRLATKSVGDDIKRCLTPEGSVMLLQRVIERKRDQLEYYSRGTNVKGFSEELYAAITALRNSGVSVAQLQNAEKDLPYAAAKKAHDMALIFQGYLEELEKEHSDSSTRLEYFAQYLLSHADMSKNYFVMDFFDFKAPEADIIRSLSKCPNLTVGICSVDGYPNSRIYPNAWINKLREMCDAEVIRQDEALSPAQDAVSRWLFSYDLPTQRVPNDNKFGLYSSTNVYDEILRVAIKIKNDVMKGVARYSDFELMTPMPDVYMNEIKSVFTRMEIPFFIDEKALLSEQTKVRYILSLLRAYAHSFAREYVLDFVKNPLFASACNASGAQFDSDVFAFENYVLKYNVQYAFFKPFDIDDKLTPQAERVRQAFEAATKAVASGSLSTAGGFALAVKRISDDVDSAWQQHVLQLEKISPYYAKCAEQVEGKLDGVLDEISDVLGDDECSADEFLNVFEAMLSKIKIALVPTFRDSVFVGDASSRFMGVGDVFILGAAQGYFPLARGGGIIISDKDEDFFKSAGIVLNPDKYQKNYTEMFAVCEILKKARGRCEISYSESTPGGKCRPSSVFSYLAGLIEEDGEPIKVQQICFDNVNSLAGDERKAVMSALFATQKSSYHEIMREAVSGRVAPQNLKPYSAAYAHLSVEDKTRITGIFDTPLTIEGRHLVGDGEPSTSISRLEQYFSCPYAHYFKYGLYLLRRDDDELLSSDTGTIIHAVLERFFIGIKDGTVPSDDVQNYVAKIFDDVISLPKYWAAAENGSKRTFAKLKDECVRVCTDLYGISLRSEFRPAMLEAEFGKNGLKPLRVDVDGQRIDVCGKIDRIDASGSDVLIIDYKSYKGADIDLKNLYYGTQLQLFVYMRALNVNMNVRTVGVFYLPVFAQFTSDDTPRYKYRGQMLDEGGIGERIDSLYATDKDASVAPYKLCGSGEGKKPDPKVHVSADTFQKLGEYAEKIAVEGLKEMKRGYVKPVPFKDKCLKCMFKDICKYSGDEVRKGQGVTLASFGVSSDEEE